MHEAQPGQVLHLSQAEGEFTLTESPATPTNNHLLMIAGGSGITPVMSQVRTLLRDGYDGKANRKVTFLHFARSEEDLIFAEELRRIAVRGQPRRRAPALRRRRLQRESLAPAGAGLPRHRHLGLRPGRDDGAHATRRTTGRRACAPSTSSSPPRSAAGSGVAPRATVSFTRPAQGGANTGDSILEQAEAPA